MEVSDLFLLISLVVAVLTLLGQEDRAFVINKFTCVDIIALVVVFIVLNYLVFFDWFSFQFSFLRHFIIIGFPQAKTWAYFISLLSISWIIYKIFKSRFPCKNYDKLILYYQDLFDRRQYKSILNNIKKFHLEDIQNYTIGKKNEFNIFLYETMICDISFLKDTSTINYFIVETLLKNENSKKNARKFYSNFLKIQFNEKKSYLNKVLNSDSFEFQSLKENNKLSILIKVIQLVEYQEFLSIIQCNVNHKTTKLENLVYFYHELIFQLSKNNNEIQINILTDLILEIIIQNKTDLTLEKYYDITINLLIYSTDNDYLFRLILENLLNILNQFCHLEQDKTKEYRPFFIHFLLSLRELYQNENLKVPIMECLIVNLEDKKYKGLKNDLIDVYDCLLKEAKIHHNEDFKMNIYDKIINY